MQQIPTQFETNSKQLQARQQLVRLLQQAHAGELAAALAYRGHANSWWARRERIELAHIETQEWQHREAVRRMIHALGGHIQPRLEKRMRWMGRNIGRLCHLGGWLIPMYGAGALERVNVWEYETAARLAWQAGERHLCQELLEMAEVEWDHERYFRRQLRPHLIGKRLPLWPDLPPRRQIRERFEDFCRSDSGRDAL